MADRGKPKLNAVAAPDTDAIEQDIRRVAGSAFNIVMKLVPQAFQERYSTGLLQYQDQALRCARRGDMAGAQSNADSMAQLAEEVRREWERR